MQLHRLYGLFTQRHVGILRMALMLVLIAAPFAVFGQASLPEPPNGAGDGDWLATFGTFMFDALGMVFIIVAIFGSLGAMVYVIWSFMQMSKGRGSMADFGTAVMVSIAGIIIVGAIGYGGLQILTDNEETLTGGE